MGIEGFIRPEKKSEQPVNRREFLKKAGKFISGGMVAASMSSQLYEATTKQTKKTLEHVDVFNINLFLKELSDLQQEYGKAWKKEAQKRFEFAAFKVVEAIKKQKKEEQKDAAGLIGFFVGSVPPFFKSFYDDLENGMIVSQEEVVKRVNELGLSGGVGNIVFRILSGVNPMKNDEQLSRAAANIAFRSLPIVDDIKSSNERNIYNKLLREAIIKNTVDFSSFFSEQLGLTSQLEWWAAGSAVMLQAIAEEAQKAKRSG